ERGGSGWRMPGRAPIRLSKSREHTVHGHGERRSSCPHFFRSRGMVCTAAQIITLKGRRIPSANRAERKCCDGPSDEVKRVLEYGSANQMGWFAQTNQKICRDTNQRLSYMSEMSPTPEGAILPEGGQAQSDRIPPFNVTAPTVASAEHQGTRSFRLRQVLLYGVPLLL